MFIGSDVLRNLHSTHRSLADGPGFGRTLLAGIHLPAFLLLKSCVCFWEKMILLTVPQTQQGF